MHGSTTARQGLRGEERFRAIVEEHRATLHAHCYLLERETGGYRAIALDVLALVGDRIAAVTAFRTPAIFPRFGLPMEVHP